MGRNRGRYTSGLTEAETAELEALEAWVARKAVQGDVGYTVHHARRDALIAKRDGGSFTTLDTGTTTVVTVQEDHEDDTD